MTRTFPARKNFFFRMRRKVLKMLGILCVSGLFAAGAGLAVNSYVYHQGRPLICDPDQVQPVQVAMVFGAYVLPNGTPSAAVEDRLLTALDLYHSGKVRKFLITGDHGHDDYDEVNAMKTYLERKGIPKEDIFLDHAGFDTYQSLVRARDVFGVKDTILVTQEFHLPRALYIAKALGLQATGVTADRRNLLNLEAMELREMGARLKAFAEVSVGRSPKFLGPAIDLSGDASVTHDKD